jgi:hypothetical protein
MYPADSTYTIYARDEWWSDDWDATEYAQSFVWEMHIFLSSYQNCHWQFRVLLS